MVRMEANKPKRVYRRREVYATDCPACGSRETRIVGRYHRKRYAKCKCGHNWSIVPRSQFN